MNHVILRDGRLMSAADFAVAYLANPTLTCAVIVPEVSFSGRGVSSPHAAPPPGVSAGSTATVSTGADNPRRQVMSTSLQPFSEWVTDHARGTLDDDITAAMAEVTRQVIDLDAKGKVLVEISIETAGSGRRTVSVAGKVTAKPPVPDPEVSIFYPDESGGLHRDDPYQTRAFDPETGEIPNE